MIWGERVADRLGGWGGDRVARVKNLSLCIAALVLGVGARAATPENIKLWDGVPPLAVPNDQPEALMPSKPGSDPTIARVGNVSDPTLAIHLPEVSRAVGTCVLVCPGGGYSIVAIDHEGTRVAEWLNSLGVAAAVLKYRVPAPKEGPAHLRPLLDAQRAMSVLRGRAKGWGIDPSRIGVLGFSAGGNLAAWLLCEGERRAAGYPVGAGEASCRPDFGVLIYPAYLTDPKRPEEHPTVRAEARPGPVFFVHAADDRILPDNSIDLFRALRAAGGQAELHVYQEGGHGFGMLRKGQPINDWPQRCAEWMGARGWLQKP